MFDPPLTVCVGLQVEKDVVFGDGCWQVQKKRRKKVWLEKV